jgi:hypothetical protein
MAASFVSRLFIYTAVVAVIAGASMARRATTPSPTAAVAVQTAHTLS